MRTLFWIVAALLGASCGGGDAASPPTNTVEIPAPDTSVMEPLVAELIERRVASVRSSPDSASAWADLGFAFDAHMLLEQAEVCLGQALELDGTLFPAAYDHAFLGVLLPRETEDVSRRFARATELQPDYGPVLVRHGDYLLESGDTAAARERFERALEVSARYEYAQLGLARCLLESDGDAELRRAAELLEPLFQAFPGDPAVATALGQALTLTGRGPRAATVAEEHAAAVAAGRTVKVPMRDALRAEILSLSRSAASNFQRGERKLRDRDFQGAALEFQRVLDVDAGNRPARQMLVTTRLALRQLDLARAELEELLRQDPRDAVSHALLGQLDTETGQFEAALQHFSQASRGDALDGITFRAWVTALGSLSRWDEALFRIGEWKASDPAAAEPYFLEAMALHNSGDKEGARAALSTATERAPGHPMRREIEPLIAR